MEKKYVTAKEIADFLNVPVGWVYQRTSIGNEAIPHIKVGKYVRFDIQSVEDFFKKQENLIKQ
jgi:excisionase family DNA binding protein